MDTIAHGLTGAMVGYCGFRQKGGRPALWASVAAGVFPDSDIILALISGETYLQWHRGPTHSLVLMPFWAAFVAASVWSVSPRANFRILWAAAAAAMASHLFLDWITNYGTLLLWPLTDRRFALSWVFIVDVYVWAALIAGLTAAIWTQRARVGQVGLGVICGFFLFCGAARAHALRSQPAGTQAYPQPMNPLRWTLVRRDGDVIHWVSGTENHTFVSYHDEDLLPKAEAAPAVKLFRWFAAFPLVEKLEENGRTTLRYRDLRFRTPMPWGGVREGKFVVAKALFDGRGRLLGAYLTNERD